MILCFSSNLSLAASGSRRSCFGLRLFERLDVVDFAVPHVGQLAGDRAIGIECHQGRPGLTSAPTAITSSTLPASA